MRQSLFLSAIVSCGVIAYAAPVFAQGAGLEWLHQHRREGRKVCMVDHFHDGTGSGKTRKLAEADAGRSWSEFTAWEYGARWGAFGNAANKSMNCTESGRSWTCVTAARPCRTGR